MTADFRQVYGKYNKCLICYGAENLPVRVLKIYILVLQLEVLRHVKNLNYQFVKCKTCKHLLWTVLELTVLFMSLVIYLYFLILFFHVSMKGCCGHRM